MNKMVSNCRKEFQAAEIFAFDLLPSGLVNLLSTFLPHFHLGDYQELPADKVASTPLQIFIRAGSLKRESRFTPRKFRKEMTSRARRRAGEGED
jgi:hypothetical protein